MNLNCIIEFGIEILLERVNILSYHAFVGWRLQSTAARYVVSSLASFLELILHSYTTTRPLQQHNLPPLGPFSKQAQLFHHCSPFYESPLASVLVYKGSVSSSSIYQ